MRITTIIGILILVCTKICAQSPINYISANTSVSKDFIIIAKSKVKIKNISKVKALIEKNPEFVNFYKTRKDSVKLGYISSLLLFKIKDNEIVLPNYIKSDFD